MGDPTAAVAKQFPDTKFAIVDVRPRASRTSHRTCAASSSPSRRQAASPASPRATVSETNTISSVGGLKIPPVDAFIAGYQDCARQVKPDIKTLNGYSQDFVAQDKCKEVALNQIGEGSDVVFQVAGQCGLGAITAAAEKSVWGVGVDSDQSFLGPHVLTSAQKKVDVGVLQTIGLVKDDQFEGGVDGLFNVENKGVGYGEVSAGGSRPRRADRRARRMGGEDRGRRGDAAAKRHR